MAAIDLSGLREYSPAEEIWSDWRDTFDAFCSLQKIKEEGEKRSWFVLAAMV